MKNNLQKIIVVFTCLFVANQIKSQVQLASQEYIDNAIAHNQLYNTVTGDNEINTPEMPESESDYEEPINNGLESLNNLLTGLRNARELYDALPGLSPGACAPDFSTNAQAMIPSSCPDANCSACYTSASNELNFVRMQLGRLWCIYTNTKNFNNAAIAFGDNASGIHAVTGLAWQYERAGIVETYNHFKGTYDKKYIDLIGSLQRALMQISSCENEYGEPDWYQRFGFIYYEFMKERYKRID
jgi:hypothetical protein